MGRLYTPKQPPLTENKVHNEGDFIDVWQRLRRALKARELLRLTEQSLLTVVERVVTVARLRRT